MEFGEDGVVIHVNRRAGDRNLPAPGSNWECEAPAELGIGSAGASPSRYKQYCRSPYNSENDRTFRRILVSEHPGYNPTDK